MLLHKSAYFLGYANAECTAQTFSQLNKSLGPKFRRLPIFNTVPAKTHRSDGF